MKKLSPETTEQIDEEGLLERLGTNKGDLLFHIKASTRVLEHQSKQAGEKRSAGTKQIEKALSMLSKTEKVLESSPDVFSKKAAEIIQDAKKKVEKTRVLAVAHQNILFDFRTHRPTPKSRKIQLKPRNRKINYEPFVVAKEVERLLENYNAKAKEQGQPLLKPFDWWGAVIMYQLGCAKKHPKDSHLGGRTRDKNEMMYNFRYQRDWWRR